MKPHWHDDNPWQNSVVYVPIERLAECTAGGHIQLVDGSVVGYSTSVVLEQWRKYGPKLDAYILPQPDGRHSIGVRYGAEGSQYLSPWNRNPKITQRLLKWGRENAVRDG